MKRILFTTITMAMLSWTSCMNMDIDSIDGQITIDEVEPYIPTMIRFETADGDNLLASYADIPGDQSYVLFRLEDLPWLDVKCERGSDGAIMTTRETHWYNPRNTDEMQRYGEGPILYFSWMDFDMLTAQNITLPHQETYTLHIRSTRFWADEEHTVTWGIMFRSRRQFTVISCAIDGKETALTSDHDPSINFVRLK